MRSAASCSGLALSPSTNAEGSPGRTYSSTNSASEAPKNTGSEIMTRRAMKAPTPLRLGDVLVYEVRLGVVGDPGDAFGLSAQQPAHADRHGPSGLVQNLEHLLERVDALRRVGDRGSAVIGLLELRERLRAGERAGVGAIDAAVLEVLHLRDADRTRVDVRLEIARDR